MATKKTSPKTSPKVVTLTKEEIMASLANHSSKSGVALKRSTVENNGTYPVVDKANGASAVTKLALYCLTIKGTIKSPNDKVKGEHMIEMLNSPSFVPVTNLIPELTGKPEWKNFGTLRSRLAKEVKSGNMNSFQANFDADAEFASISPKLKKILK